MDEKRAIEVYSAIRPFLDEICDIAAHGDMVPVSFNQFVLHAESRRQEPEQERTEGGPQRNPLHGARQIMSRVRHVFDKGKGQQEDTSRRLSPPQRDKGGDSTPGGGGPG